MTIKLRILKGGVEESEPDDGDSIFDILDGETRETVESVHEFSEETKMSTGMGRKDVEILLENLEIKTDLKFERLVGESNLKFANMMSETRQKFDEALAESRRLSDEALAETRRLSDAARAESDLKFSKGQTLIAEAESKHAKWVIGLAFTMIAFVIASVGFSTTLILKAVEKENQGKPQQQPIIINVPQSNVAPTEDATPKPEPKTAKPK